MLLGAEPGLPEGAAESEAAALSASESVNDFLFGAFNFFEKALDLLPLEEASDDVDADDFTGPPLALSSLIVIGSGGARLVAAAAGGAPRFVNLFWEGSSPRAAASVADADVPGKFR